MVWAVSQTATTLTLTPDGTTSANLSDLLDLAISTLTTTAGVTKPSLYTYDLAKKLLIAADASSNYLYVSGLNLILRDQFIRASNSRVRFGNVNAAGAVVGKANVIIYNQPDSSYAYTNAPFTAGGSNALVAADDLTLIFRRINSSGGSIVNGYDIASLSVGSFTGCSFQSDSNGDSSNAIFFLSAEAYTSCIFTGWAVCELAAPNSLLSRCTFSTVSTLKCSVAGNFYFEGVTANLLGVQKTCAALLVDCAIASFNNVSGNATSTDSVTLKNSIQLLGGTNEANGLFVARLSSNVQVIKRTFNASGLISGGNSIGATDGVTTSSERLLISVYKLLGNPLAVNFDYRGAWEGVFVKYGRLPTVFSFNLQGTTATLQNVPFASLLDTGITVSNSATVAAYTTIAINHSTSLVTISGVTTQRQLHDYCALEKASFADSGVTTGSNPVPKCCFPTLGSPIYNRPVGTFLYNLSISAGATLTGTDSVTLAAGKNITLAAVGTYTTSPIEVSSTSIVTVAPGNTDLRGWLFASGSTINVSSTTAIVTVDASQLANITAGTGVTIQAPTATISITTTIGASISLRKASDNSPIASGTADGSGNFTAPYVGSPISAILRVRKAGYIPVSNTVSITSSGLTVSAVLAVDSNYNPTY